MRKGEKCLTRRNYSIVPRDESGLLLNVVKMREYVRDAEPQARQRLVAFLSTVYTGPQLVEMLDTTKQYVNTCRRLHPEIVEAAILGRNYAIADMTERRVIELLQTMNVANIPDEKKPQSIKYLMDSGAIAHQQSKPPDESVKEDVHELIFRIRSKMLKRKEVEDDAIDINNEVQDVKVKKETPPALPPPAPVQSSAPFDDTF
jgi:hypothetical protein